MIFVWLFSFYLSAANAGSGPRSSNCNIRVAEFIPAEKSFRELGYNLDVGLAAPKIVVHDGLGHHVTCAASAVSDRGHLLTAGHCLETCLNTQSVYVEGPDGSVADPTKLREARCRLDINGVRTEARVLAINKCKFSETWGPQPKRCSGLDYALLDVDPVPDAQSRRCMGVGAQAASVDSAVSALSYPPKTLRRPSDRNASDVSDNSQYMANGRVIESTSKCTLKSARPSVVDISGQQITDLMKERVQAGVLLQTTVDQIKGTSGAGLFKSDTGELVGIGSMSGRTSIQGVYSECSGSTFFVSLPAVMEDIKVNAPHINLSSVFSCPQNKQPR